MDLDDFRAIILESGLDVWTWIDMSISVASADHLKELKIRRDAIVQKLYAPAFYKCQKCNKHVFEGPSCNGKEIEEIEQKQTYNSEEIQSEKMLGHDDHDVDQGKIVEIKNLIHFHGQNEGKLIELLKRLVDMNITFKVLKETDIGRHVTRLRKHSCDEVRRLVKILVRKWKGTVDEWVKLSTPEEEPSRFSDDTRLKNYDVHSGSMKAETTPSKRNVKINQNESENVFSASKRLFNGNHQETPNAKQQRTALAMTKTKNKNAQAMYMEN